MKTFKHSILRPLSTDNGFTLIEAVVAIAVVTIGVLAINAMQTGAVRGNARANQITAAATWAGDYMEQINRMDYDDLLDTDGDGFGGLDDIDANADGTLNDAVNYPLFTLYYNVAPDYPINADPDREEAKTVRIIIVRNTDGQPFTFNYIMLNTDDL